MRLAVSEAAAASAELADQLHEVGNISAVQLGQELAATTRA